MLHLVGYRDKTPSDAQQMRAAEAAISCSDLALRRSSTAMCSQRELERGPVNPDALFWIAIAGAVAACLAAVAARSLREFSRRDLEEICQRRERRSASPRSCAITSAWPSASKCSPWLLLTWRVSAAAFGAGSIFALADRAIGW